MSKDLFKDRDDAALEANLEMERLFFDPSLWKRSSRSNPNTSVIEDIEAAKEQMNLEAQNPQRR